MVFWPHIVSYMHFNFLWKWTGQVLHSAHYQMNSQSHLHFFQWWVWFLTVARVSRSARDWCIQTTTHPFWWQGHIEWCGEIARPSTSPQKWHIPFQQLFPTRGWPMCWPKLTIHLCEGMVFERHPQHFCDTEDTTVSLSVTGEELERTICLVATLYSSSTLGPGLGYLLQSRSQDVQGETSDTCRFVDKGSEVHISEHFSFFQHVIQSDGVGSSTIKASLSVSAS